MTERPLLIVFDIDGTLLDVFDLHIKSYHAAILARFKVAADEDALIAAFGKPEADCFRAALKGKMLSSADLRALSEVRKEAFVADLPSDLSSQLLPGVKETLGWLQGKVPLAFITGNNPGTGMAIVRAAGLEAYSQNCAFGEQAKDRPGLVKMVCERAGVRTKDALVVGDSIHDVHAALKAGATPVGVASYQHSMDELKAAGATLVFEDMRGLLAYLESHF